MDTDTKKQFTFMDFFKTSQKNKLIAVTVTAVVLIIGYTVFRLGAAGFFASFEAEQGTADQAQIVNDSGASGGKAIQFAGASTPPPNSGLPTGVTLRDIDGGADYFSKWSNSFPTDPNFFPIAVFSTYDSGATVFNGLSRAASHKAVGINTYVNFSNGAESGSPPDLQVAKDQGIRGVVDPSPHVLTSTFNNTYGNAAAGYVYQDEIDGSGNCSQLTDWYSHLITQPCKIGSFEKIDPSILLNMDQNLRAKDSTRAIYQGYTNAFAMDWYPGGPVSTLAAAADVIGYDIYVKVDKRSDYGGQLDVGKTWAAYQSVMSARKNANFSKPIWPDVETSPTDTGTDEQAKNSPWSILNADFTTPTPQEVKSLVWNYIIGGARGITYFNHCFCERYDKAKGTSYTGHDDLNNPALAPIRTAVAETNAQIARLASVINAPYADGYVTNINGQVNVMAKYHAASNSMYIFAGSKSTSAQNVTFTIKGGKSVSVDNENRTIPLNGGSFQDSFAGEAAYHIYKISL